MTNAAPMSYLVEFPAESDPLVKAMIIWMKRRILEPRYFLVHWLKDSFLRGL